jgi:hypothetical protein
MAWVHSSLRSTFQPGTAFAVEDIPSGWVWLQQPHIVRDLEQEIRFPQVMQSLREYGVRSFCCLPTVIQVPDRQWCDSPIPRPRSLKASSRGASCP